jgi:hypothetical protein
MEDHLEEYLTKIYSNHPTKRNHGRERSKSPVGIFSERFGRIDPQIVRRAI